MQIQPKKVFDDQAFLSAGHPLAAGVMPGSAGRLSKGVLNQQRRDAGGIQRLIEEARGGRNRLKQVGEFGTAKVPSLLAAWRVV